MRNDVESGSLIIIEIQQFIIFYTGIIYIFDSNLVWRVQLMIIKMV